MFVFRSSGGHDAATSPRSVRGTIISRYYNIMLLHKAGPLITPRALFENAICSFKLIRKLKTHKKRPTPLILHHLYPSNIIMITTSKRWCVLL